VAFKFFAFLEKTHLTSWNVPNAECGSPMMILYIITTLYQILRFLKSLNSETAPVPPNVEPQPASSHTWQTAFTQGDAGRRRCVATAPR